MTHALTPSEMSRLEAITAHDLPPGTRLDADEEATRAAFLAWATELQQQAGAVDHQAILKALEARLQAAAPLPQVTIAGQDVHAAGGRKARGSLIVLAAGGLGLAMVLLLAVLLNRSPQPLAIAPGGGAPAANAVPTIHEQATNALPHGTSDVGPAGGLFGDAAPGPVVDGVAARQPAVVSTKDASAIGPGGAGSSMEGGHFAEGGQSTEGVISLAWEDPLDAELWWARQVLVRWSRAPSRVDGRLAWMENRLKQLHQELMGDSL